MAIITDQSNLFNFIETKSWLGQYSGSQGSQDFMGTFFSTTYNPTIDTVSFNSRAKLTHGFNTYYKLQGYNTTTNSYETWFSMGDPLYIPPSGNTLSNIEVILVWTDR